MRLHLLASLGDNTGVEEDGENTAVQLVINLNPLDGSVDSLIETRVRVLDLNLTERRIEQFSHVLVDEGDANTGKPELCFE